MNRLLQKAYADGAAVNYTYDNGNVAAITNNRDNTRSQNFTYDALNRLATAQTQTTGVTIPNSNCWGLTFGYDPWGNLLTSSTTGPAGCGEPLPLNVFASNKNQMTTTAGQQTGYCYDAAGNLVLQATCPASNPVYAYTYNAENQLTATAGVTYTYDGDGKRVQKSNGTIYWYGMGSDALDETDLTGSLTNSSFHEYVFFGGKRIARRDSSNNVFYYFADHLGTARVTEQVPAGQTTVTLCYDADFYPFGGERIVTDTCDSAYKFTSKERDAESGLDNFGTRYYSNAMGRWTSPDKPFADQHRQNPQSWNLYMYAANRPTSLIDTDGEEVKEVTNTVYYHVSGSTAGEAWNNAPKVSGIAGGYRGNTDTNIGVGHYDFNYKYQSGPSGTTVTDTVKSTDVNLSVTTTLVTWDGYKDASPEEQKQWDSFAGDLQDHENGHKEIAEKAAGDLDKSLPGTTATGSGKNLTDARKDADSKLSGKIEDKHQQTVQDTQKKQDAYDKKTEHGVHQERKNDPD